MEDRDAATFVKNMPDSLIALMTDFGDRDGFTGVMKGVINCIYPGVPLVDVAHHIPPQDVRHGSWVLNQAFDVFPEGTVFVAVVDPHVGNPAQEPMAVNFPQCRKTLVLPNNGLCTRIIQRGLQYTAIALKNPRYYREQAQPSHTFHGRDIYASVAAHLAKANVQSTLAALLTDLGPQLPAQDVGRLPVKPAQKVSASCFKGEIDVIDTYGNLITNIPSHWLPAKAENLQLTLLGNCISVPYTRWYEKKTDSTGESGSLLTLIAGSHGMLELALPQGSAHQQLGATPGSAITLQCIGK